MLSRAVLMKMAAWQMHVFRDSLLSSLTHCINGQRNSPRRCGNNLRTFSLSLPSELQRIRDQRVAVSTPVIPTISYIRATFPGSLLVFVFRPMSGTGYSSNWQFGVSRNVALVYSGTGFLPETSPGNSGSTETSHFDRHTTHNISAEVIVTNLCASFAIVH